MSKKRIVKVYQTQPIPTKKPDNRVLYAALGGMLLVVCILLVVFFSKLLSDNDTAIPVDGPHQSAPLSLNEEGVASEPTEP